MAKELKMYELVLFFKVTLPEQELKTKIERYRDFLTEKGSQVMVQNRGKRSLSYNIKGFETANYIQMVYVGNKKLINSLDITISRDESILRHLTTKVRQLPQILD